MNVLIFSVIHMYSLATKLSFQAKLKCNFPIEVANFLIFLFPCASYIESVYLIKVIFLYTGKRE
jgi:hypothetical protein